MKEQLVNIAIQLKESFVIHESHKLSQEFSSKADSIDVLFYKD